MFRALVNMMGNEAGTLVHPPAVSKSLFGDRHIVWLPGGYAQHLGGFGKQFDFVGHGKYLASRSARLQREQR